MPKVGMQPIRRQQLIEATLTAVDQVGMADASIALIARLAGVSNGIISHYFRDKNGLIAATMRYLMNVLIDNVTERRQALDDDSRGPLQIFVQVQRLDGSLGGKAVLEARWSLRTDDDAALARGAFVDSEPAGQDYDSLVRAESALVQRLAAAMAEPLAGAARARRVAP